MSEGFTININPLWFYAVLKLGCAVFITRKQLQYPVWENGVQTKRPLHRKIQVYVANAFCNPELSMVKMMAFLPVAFFTGSKHIHSFLPWHVSRPPYFCEKCRDTGTYKNMFFGSNADICNCCTGRKLHPEAFPEAQAPVAITGSKCLVCLDAGHIGKNRPCPHCLKRNLTLRQTNGEKPWKNGKEVSPLPNLGPAFPTTKGHTDADLEAARVKARSSDGQGSPIGSLWLWEGDIINVVGACSGHRDSGLVDKDEYLRIEAVNYPFLAVQRDARADGTRNRLDVTPIDARGLEFLRIAPNKSEVGKAPSPPPKLRLDELTPGRTVVLISGVNPNKGDLSWRGQCFIIHRVCGSTIDADLCHNYCGGMPSKTILDWDLDLEFVDASPTYLNALDGQVARHRTQMGRQIA